MNKAGGEFEDRRAEAQVGEDGVNQDRSPYSWRIKQDSLPVSKPTEPDGGDGAGFSFDRRPGFFEATRVGRETFAVLGKREGDGWKVMLLGPGIEVALTAEEAGELADELRAMVEVLEGRWAV